MPVNQRESTVTARYECRTPIIGNIPQGAISINEIFIFLLDFLSVNRNL